MTPTSCPPAEITEREATLRTENNKLRALLAASDKPCAYCGLDAVDIAKCPSGFPGCARMDDLMQAAETEKDLKAQDALLTAYNEVAEREAAAYRRGQQEMREEIAENAHARAVAERLMRDKARRAQEREVAELHGDRAQAFDELVRAISAIPIKEKPE